MQPIMHSAVSEFGGTDHRQPFFFSGLRGPSIKWFDRHLSPGITNPVYVWIGVTFLCVRLSRLMTQDEFIIPLMSGNQRFDDTGDEGSNNSSSIKRALSTSCSVSIRPEQLFSDNG